MFCTRTNMVPFRAYIDIYYISSSEKQVSMAAPGATIGHTLSSPAIVTSITTGLPAVRAVVK